MKKIILFLLLTPAFLICYPQSGSFLDTNKLWSVLRYPYMKYPTHYTHFLKIGTDTTMNDTVFSKLLRCDEESQSNWYEYGYLREDSTGKVFYRIDESPPEGLIYYGSAKVGDTLMVGTFDEYYDKITSLKVRIDSVDSVKINDTYRKKFFIFSFLDSLISDYWIEKIGSLNGLLYHNFNRVGGDGYLLLCFKQNDILLFKVDKYDDCYDEIDDITTINNPGIEVYPNPSKGKQLILLVPGPESYHFQVSNAMGDAVIRRTISGQQEYMINTGHLQPGMYILTVYGQLETVLNEKIILY
ncbi:MAG: T9SS type A sorting domain-containing protein [Bacteroidota bacterium]